MGSPGRRSRGALGEGKGGGLCGRQAPLVSLTLPPGLVLATRCWSGECLIGSIDLGAPDSRRVNLWSLPLRSCGMGAR